MTGWRWPMRGLCLIWLVPGARSQRHTPSSASCCVPYRSADRQPASLPIVGSYPLPHPPPSTGTAAICLYGCFSQWPCPPEGKQREGGVAVSVGCFDRLGWRVEGRLYASLRTEREGGVAVFVGCFDRLGWRVEGRLCASLHNRWPRGASVL